MFKISDHITRQEVWAWFLGLAVGLILSWLWALPISAWIETLGWLNLVAGCLLGSFVVAILLSSLKENPAYWIPQGVWIGFVIPIVILWLPAWSKSNHNIPIAITGSFVGWVVGIALIVLADPKLDDPYQLRERKMRS